MMYNVTCTGTYTHAQNKQKKWSALFCMNFITFFIIFQRLYYILDVLYFLIDAKINIGTKQYQMLITSLYNRY